ncbi:MAG: glycosyltransferase family 2 protein [Caldilineaceae bacterium]
MIAPTVNASLHLGWLSSEPILSIIIINWNTCTLTTDCLQSVAEEAIHLSIVSPEHGAIQTIVVDNASSDDSVTHIRHRFPWVQLIENETNVGFAAANNQALSHCTGKYILLLNSDTKVLPGGLQELIDFMETHPEAGAAGSRYLNPDGSLQSSCYPAPTVSRELWRMFHLDQLHAYGIYPMHNWPVDEPRVVDIIQGAAFLLRREIVVELGLFDPAYFMYSEEVDLCRRIWQSGWQIYWIPQSRVIHYGGQSTRQVALTMFLQLYQSKILYFRKHHGQLATWSYKWVLMLAALVRLLLTPLAWTQSSEKRSRALALASQYYHLAVALPSM